ncbi:MAG: hypothetical protein U1E51_10215, partial [Candidatus Binatia bacterium]|nr:hypothetical protein [Candidatus Binatia bacterium]
KLVAERLFDEVVFPLDFHCANLAQGWRKSCRKFVAILARLVAQTWRKDVAIRVAIMSRYIITL